MSKSSKTRWAWAAALLVTAACGRGSAPDDGAASPDRAASPDPAGEPRAEAAPDTPGRDVASASDTGAAALARFRARVPASALVRRGACPFECCTYREWRAESPIAVVAAERSRGPASFTIPAGQHFRADSGNVWITGLMLVVVRDSIADPPYWSFAPGDTLVVLEPVGEGYYGVWHEGRVQQVEGFWEPWRQRPGARTLGEHRTEWWVHVTLPDGRAGWFEAGPQARFSGADACG